VGNEQTIGLGLLCLSLLHLEQVRHALGSSKPEVRWGLKERQSRASKSQQHK